MDKEELFFAISHWGEFGQKRYTATLSIGEKRRISLVVPRGRWWLVFRYRFGDIQADVINFRFDNVRNYFEQDILIGTELLNHTVWPKPYISISGDSGAIVVENIDTVNRDFSIVLDFIIIDDEIAGRMRELIISDREKFRGEVTEQAGTGGA